MFNDIRWAAENKIEPNDIVFEAVFSKFQETFEKNCILLCYDKFSKNLMPVNFTISFFFMSKIWKIKIFIFFHSF